MVGSTTKITRNDFSKAVEKARAAAFQHNFELADATAEEARKLCPESDNNEPGHIHLKDTIRVEKDEQTGAANVVAGDLEKGVDHALPVELGTVHMSPEPYMIPAVERVKGRAANRNTKIY